MEDRRVAIFYDHFDSPVGLLLLVGDSSGLRRIQFPKERHAVAIDPSWKKSRTPFREARAQLEAYFARRLVAFDLPLLPEGTPFQLKVWEALRAIPYGTKISYGELACRVGNVKACRAVGAANGRNPLPIIVPCHRVIGNDGDLTGFGGGLSTKRFLLDLEGAGEHVRQRSLFAEMP
jgi:methylated-DNA-[protein]-cysteine S-methyltransferase